MARPPASEQVQVNFRMPADLKARIEAAAEANGRSTTSELVAALEKEYPAPLPTFRSLLVDLMDLLKVSTTNPVEMLELADSLKQSLAGMPEDEAEEFSRRGLKELTPVIQSKLDDAKQRRALGEVGARPTPPDAPEE
ncbi:Arc family DNA-binding protein [Pseudogemmobacter bohemicus]|uniref:Arc family DNA-binding protein n=1 Tax=Pseudogemmobacter bohemicus TaxID=2250708 RepID=UPI000DD4820B|nr:Arc family DNA-binding protein [Pseudogemmobacter bohemicus]